VASPESVGVSEPGYPACALSSRADAQTDIQAALSQIDIVLSHHDLVDREELGIKRGSVRPLEASFHHKVDLKQTPSRPSSSNIKPYQASIDRLIAAQKSGTGKDEGARMVWGDVPEPSVVMGS
jgi:hypothetical protein